MVKTEFLIHSCPAWVLGPKSLHPKFGGGIVANGYGQVEVRLLEIAKNFPGDLTSMHLLHELKTTQRTYAKFNNPNAISWKSLLNGIENGIFPQVAALTAPAFGLPGIGQGSILSPNEEIARMAFKMHKEAIVKSMDLRKRKMGKGIVLWWPAFDSIVEMLRQVLTEEQAWNILVKFWVDIIRETENDWSSVLEDSESVILFEWKPAVPGIRDYVNTVRRAIRFCQEVNANFGNKKVMKINNESAHLLISGVTVERGTRLTIEAGLFPGFFHANSAELSTMSVDEETGRVLRGAPADDKDWFAGAGGNERYDDQARAMKLIINKSGFKTVIVEHDIDPSGLDSLNYYALSRSNVERMAFEASTA
jgi:hypothetical protein